jgi:hypothetical protein
MVINKVFQWSGGQYSQDFIARVAPDNFQNCLEIFLIHYRVSRITPQITRSKKHSEEQAALFAVRVNFPCYVICFA